jgi:hypothetical protein
MADLAWTPINEVEKAEVRDQIEHVITHPAFKSSAHCVKFLRYVIESTLCGEGDRIKERTIGVDVFGRDPDYDVAQDRVVRATAAEVRKRIAQYYYGPDHAKEIRFDFRPGSTSPNSIFQLIHQRSVQNSPTQAWPFPEPLGPRESIQNSYGSPLRAYPY